MLLFTRRFCRAVTFSLIFFFSNNLFAATLSIADNLVVRELDDKALDDSFFSSKQSIQLSKGSHTLLIKYKDVYEDLDFAEERLVESELFIVKFDLTDQKKLKLMTPKIKNLSAAEKFSQSPEIIIVDENNTALVLQLEKHEDYKLAKQVKKVVTTLPNANVITSGNRQVNASSETISFSKKQDDLPEEQQTFNEQVLTQAKSLPMLKYWWQKASAKDKQDFILYIKGQ